jgi:hypothetical protein
LSVSFLDSFLKVMSSSSETVVRMSLRMSTLLSASPLSPFARIGAAIGLGIR